MEIAICDDEKHICSELEVILEKILDKLGIKYKIDIYLSGEMLCNQMEAKYNLIFLDVKFVEGEISGVQVGRYIRDKLDMQLTSIVYMSWNEGYSKDLHRVRPIDFLIKPIKYSQVEYAVTTHLKLFKLWSDEFIYKIKSENRKVRMCEIVYIESENRKLILHLSNGKTEEFYGKLNEVFSQQLKKADFIHIHASYVVNYSHIVSFTSTKLTVTTGITLPISRCKKDEVEETYFAITRKQEVV
ncbi:MAG: LytTR family DNA-binding domain-containing protein [Defluviitaleaceae bacterium]|nr:LytTR family DNA-binding domain-containing protein [Defluviitaleaceae bacterium]